VQFGKIQNPTNAQKIQYNEEVQRVQEIAKADPNDVFLKIGNDLGALMDAYGEIGKAFLAQEAEAAKVYTGKDSIGKRALNRVIVKARLDAMFAELRETMVYKAPPELGDLWGKYEKMWQKIVVEQDEAHKRETAKMQIEAAQRRRLIRKRKEEAVWVGAILFVVAWYVGVNTSSNEPDVPWALLIAVVVLCFVLVIALPVMGMMYMDMNNAMYRAAEETRKMKELRLKVLRELRGEE
jgi:hypothetical protein